MDEFTRQVIAEADQAAADFESWQVRRGHVENDDELCRRLSYSPSELALRRRLSPAGREHMDLRKLQQQASAAAAQRVAVTSSQMSTQEQEPWNVWARSIAAEVAKEWCEAYRLKVKLDGETHFGVDAVIEIIRTFDKEVIDRLYDQINKYNGQQDKRVDRLARTVTEMSAEIEAMRAKLEKRSARSKVIPFLDLKGGHNDGALTRN